MSAFWICSVIGVLGAGLTMVSGGRRSTAFSLWLASMGVGGVYLSLGFEYLSVVTWISGTVLACSYLFHSLLFADIREEFSPKTYLMGFFCGLIFFLMVGLGFKDVSVKLDDSPAINEIFSQGFGPQSLVIILVIGVCLFISLIGIGIFSRRGDS